MTESITQVLTCDDIHAGFDTLIARIAGLALERDRAREAEAEALEAACRLQQERDQEKARADEQAAQALTQATLAARFRNRLEEVHTELRQTRNVCRNLAVVANDALEEQIDHMQNQPEPRPDDHTRRWPFKRAGNSL